MTPRLRLWGDEDRVELSMVRWNLSVVLVRDLGPIMIRSDLSQLSLRKLVCIQDLMLVSSQGGGFGGDIKLGIISKAVEVETMANDIAKGEQVEYEC